MGILSVKIICKNIEDSRIIDLKKNISIRLIADKYKICENGNFTAKILSERESRSTPRRKWETYTESKIKSVLEQIWIFHSIAIHNAQYTTQHTYDTYLGRNKKSCITDDRRLFNYFLVNEILIEHIDSL